MKSRKRVPLHDLEFEADGNVLTIGLPSGRQLFYQSPRVALNKFGRDALVYSGVDQVIKKWAPLDTYGGKLVENITQAVSRDVLAAAMQKINVGGYPIVMHVHDEVICEVPEEGAEQILENICNIMGEEVSWAPGLPLTAEGYLTKFYKKD